uniref:Uncharacterized protein n=1 Tax=Sphaerodactylus townsendi TaxID=933632 RepID=A0ACB8E4A6_9SAUR
MVCMYYHVLLGQIHSLTSYLRGPPTGGRASILAEQSWLEIAQIKCNLPFPGQDHCLIQVKKKKGGTKRFFPFSFQRHQIFPSHLCPGEIGAVGTLSALA